MLALVNTSPDVIASFDITPHAAWMARREGRGRRLASGEVL